MSWIDRYSRNPFVKNVAVMFSGNGLAIIVPFLMAPFISRIYTPEDFAAFELWVRILGLVVIVGSLRLEFAILLPKTEEEVLSLVSLCFRILVLITIISSVILLPLAEVIGELLNNSQVPDLIYLLPFAVLAQGVLNILNQYLIKTRSFKESAFSKITMAGSNNVGKFLLGLKYPTPIGLSLGHFLGVFTPVVLMLRLKRVRHLFETVFQVKVATRYLFHRYKDFPLVNTFHAFFHECQYATLLFLVSSFYGELALGLFGFAFRYLKVPLTVFGSSIGQVLNEQWARQLNEGLNIRSSILKVVSFLFLVGILPFASLFFFGEEIFSFVFGHDWTIAGHYAEIIAPWLLVNFVSSPISSLPILLHRQTAFFKISVVSGVLNIALVIIANRMGLEFDKMLFWLSGLNVAILLFVVIWLVQVGSMGRLKTDNSQN
ncbi:MAG: oligosaccharide flippase family protein [Flavobacteriales bacterium]|nr:oligosaccharide flippase family protein [Flavobacteriales bacterium]